MKKFNVYKHPTLGMEVVKVGFSWPAFFLGVLWLLAKELWGVAGTWFAVYVALSFIEKATDQSQGGAQSLVHIFFVVGYFSLWLVPGFKGNKWREENLLKQGYVQIYRNEGIAINEVHDAPESLIGATWRGNSSIVNQLIRDGADINEPNAIGLTALDVASARGDVSTVLLLLAHGAHTQGTQPITQPDAVR